MRLPPSAGALRSRLYAAGAVSGERSSDDGSIELTVELPEVELMALARTPGVEILTKAESPKCLVRPKRPTYNRLPS